MLKVNWPYLKRKNSLTVSLIKVEAEVDEQWSFVGKKSNQRWLWYAIDHMSRELLAFAFGKRKDSVFARLKRMLAPFQIQQYYTDDWGT